MSFYKNTNLLIVDDDEAIIKIFERLSKDRGWSYEVAKSAEEALELLGNRVFETAVMDIKLPGFTGLQLLEHLKQNNIPTEVVMMTGVGSEETAVMAMKRGAYDYLTKPFDDIDRVAIIITKAMDRFSLIQKLKVLERKGADEGSYEELIGKSKKMQEVFDVIESIAPTKSTVLIQGESGTGKELVARAIHTRSKRKDKPFIVINCSAIPINLLESELFGHKKGSFTGAIADKKGLFDVADGGTIFLDEIGEVPPTIQVKLLRVLQEGEVRAVGENIPDKVDVRLIAATNKDLSTAIKERGFREDLYYRINVIGIYLPPLRDRVEDIPVLAYHFLKKCTAKLDKKVKHISVDALQVLQNYSWIGNVRELENVIERAVVLATSDEIEISDLPPKILGESFYISKDNEDDVDISQFSYREAKRRAMASFNKVYLTSILKKASGNISFAADKAKMDRSNFKKLIRKYSVEVDDFKNEEEGLK